MAVRPGTSADLLFAFPEGLPVSAVEMTNPNAAIQKLLNRAMSAYNSQDLPEAEKFCRKVIAADRNSFEALHLLGVVQAALGKKEKALVSYDQAISLWPGNAAVFSNRGILLTALNRFDEALTSFDRALAIEPRFAEAFNNRGNTLLALKRYDEALANYVQALGVRPDYAQAMHNRGTALYHLERFEDALASYDRAIELRSDFHQAYVDRGLVLRALKRFEEVLENYDNANAWSPRSAEVHDNRANILFELKRFEEALENCDRAIELKPDFAKAHVNRALVLKALKRFEEAVESCDKAIALKKEYAEAYSTRGDVLHELRRPNEAIISYENAISIDGEHVTANGNLSHSLLLLGNFERGWRQYEWRKKLCEPIANPSFPQPAWLGESAIAGKTLFIHSEQGLGDTLQFCRYVKLVRAFEARVIFGVQRPLVRLIQDMDADIEVISEEDTPETFDYHCALISLPLALKTTENNIPSAIPYLRADQSRIEKWKHRIGSEKFKVGICWQGSAIGTNMGKSFLLNNFFAISKLTEIRLISLQKGDGTDQLNYISKDMYVEHFGDELDAGDDAFLDTAAIMESLDLIITTDTSVAHLAGALGRPVWVALKYVPDWRWGLEGDTTSWYPSMRLFRQKSRDDWDGVFSEIERELRLTLQAKALTTEDDATLKPMGIPKPPANPLSWG